MGTGEIMMLEIIYVIGIIFLAISAGLFAWIILTWMDNKKKHPKIKSEIPDHPMCRCDPVLKIGSEGKDFNYRHPDYDYKNDVWRRHGDMEILSKVRHKHFLKMNPDLYTPIYEDVKEGEYDV